MNKNIFLGVLALYLLILVSFVSATGVVDITSVDIVSANPGSSVVMNVTVSNTLASTTIPTVTLTSSNLLFGSYVINAPTIASITTLVSGTPQTRSFSVNIPYSPAGTYTGNITAQEAGNSTNQDTFLYQITINSIAGLNVSTYTIDNPLILSEKSGESKSATFTITNTGSITLTSITATTNATLSDNDGDNITISFSSLPTSLAPGASDTVTVTATIPSKQDLGIYQTSVNINDVVYPSANVAFKLEVRVQPEVCEDGPQGDDLEIDINEPDDGDEFSPGETIGIELDVDNNGDDNLDVVLEAFLYNIDEDDELERVESEVTEIREGKSEEFNLDLEIPTEDLDEDDEYVLFIKAYEDGEEDNNCIEESLEIDIQREKDSVDIKSVTLTPPTAKCGETIEVSVAVENFGTKDQDDVTVRLLESTLKLDQTTDSFDLEDYNSKDNDAVKRFSFEIPEDAAEKSYSVEAIVTYKDGAKTNSEFATLKVENCEEEAVTPTGVTTYTADLNKEIKTLTLLKGDSLIFVIANEQHQLEITSTSATSAILVIRSDPITLSLNIGESRSIDLDADGIDDITITLNSLTDGKALLTIKKEVSTGVSGVTGAAATKIKELFSGSAVFWIIGDIVLVVIAIFFIRLIFAGGRKKERTDEEIRTNF